MKNSKLVIWFQELRVPFFTASVIPVLVGTALAYSAANVFHPVLFILAVLGIVALHAGANIANDYFDHTSGNDWLNKNVTPFSGGSQLIQQGLLSPKSVLIAAWIALSIGGLTGIIILLLTKSFFILALGIAGLLGGYFYTASPVRLGYRGIGELIIGLLFGVLPVYGSYYLQTRTIDFVPLVPGIIVAMLIFLVILVNEFPDAPADSAVNKKTLVVVLGDKPAVWSYRAVLLATYCVIIVAILIFKIMVFPGLLYLTTLPLAVLALKFLNCDVLQKSGEHTANKLTILLHLVGGVMLSLGFLLSGS
ncbi:MAG TPA: 1,4-dihydroxy-2-naphthoate octaprenyltransferase [Phycisphaerales bacterium]|nr:1,4-dihydroxy-2-naphthoate octaprenyltransferase [Phycisphaerales bacterium]